jgi:hypothetical protein
MYSRGGDEHYDGAVFLAAVFLSWAFQSGTVFWIVMAFLPIKILLRYILEK